MKARSMKTQDAEAVHEGSGNVYADLGFADSEGMLVRAQLVTKIAEILRERRLSQEQAAKLLHLTQPKVSAMLRGNFRGISERRLLRCLTRLGRDVRILVKKRPSDRRDGQVTVRFE